MAQSLSNVIVHIVFSTKHRKAIIPGNLEYRLYGLIGGKIKSMKGEPIQINGTVDHIHILTSLPRTTSNSDFIKRIKTGSTKWMRTQGFKYKDFAWQKGYGVFSVSNARVQYLKQYIINQKDHHKKQDFKDEFIQILEECDVSFFSEYLWD